MSLHIEERVSDSPFVERVWRSRSEQIDTFTSIAVAQWDLVFWTQEGKTSVAVQGPETQSSSAPVPKDAEFFGILFKAGTFMPHLPVHKLVNGSASLAEAASNSFWLKGEAWQIPTYDNAETFVEWMVRDDLLVREPVVDAVVQGYLPDMSLRTAQRRFINATGLTHRTLHQIERARFAAILLQEGLSILDTVDAAGYFDQPHLTKSLKLYIGQTPAQLMDKSRAEQLSLLYKTSSFCGDIL